MTIVKIKTSGNIDLKETFGFPNSPTATSHHHHIMFNSQFLPILKLENELNRRRDN